MGKPYQQLQMLWPQDQSFVPQEYTIPSGYTLRPYLPGDEPHFYQIMEQAGWPGWNADTLRPWQERILPGGWSVVVHQTSGLLAASAMALTSTAYPGGGEFGWLVASPQHYGKGLGIAVTAAATANLISAQCRPIHLYTEHWRLAAIKIYLTLGYRPYLYTSEMPVRWRQVCKQLKWPYQPSEWNQGNLHE